MVEISEIRKYTPICNRTKEGNERLQAEQKALMGEGAGNLTGSDGESPSRKRNRSKN
jgi:hypothetical protein